MICFKLVLQIYEKIFELARFFGECLVLFQIFSDWPQISVGFILKQPQWSVRETKWESSHHNNLRTITEYDESRMSWQSSDSYSLALLLRVKR